MREVDPDHCKDVRLSLHKGEKRNMSSSTLGIHFTISGAPRPSFTVASRHDHDLVSLGVQRLKTLRKEGLDLL